MEVTQESSLGWKFLSLTRIVLGFTFLWAFLDKLIGLGFGTCKDRETGVTDIMCEKAWLNGGTPTKGFLGGASGPLGEQFQGLADIRLLDWLFMIALLGIGLALMLGIGTKVAAWTAALLLILMYLAGFSPETNPVIDDHIIHALAAIGIVYVELQRQDIGIGNWWRKLEIVKKNPWLV